MSARDAATAQAAIQAALVAAEAMAKVEELHRRLDAFSEALALAGRYANCPEVTAAAERARRPALRLVDTEAQP